MGHGARGIDAFVMLIRSVQASDATAMAEILSHYIEHTTISFQTNKVDENRMKQIIAGCSPQYPFLVAVSQEGDVLGFAYAHAWRSYEAYQFTAETTIYLHPSACGNGVGRKLMDRLIADCRAAGLHSLIACVTQNNEKSKAFHLSLGFQKVSHMRAVGYKFGKWLDVIDYQLIL